MQEELSRFKLLITVNAERSMPSGKARQEFSNLIGQRILDAWHGTNEAPAAIAGSGATDAVEVHKEILFCEQAVLLLAEGQFYYPFEAGDRILAEAAHVIDCEISARWKRQLELPVGE